MLCLVTNEHPRRTHILYSKAGRVVVLPPGGAKKVDLHEDTYEDLRAVHLADPRLGPRVDVLDDEEKLAAEPATAPADDSFPEPEVRAPPRRPARRRPEQERPRDG